jgi:phosphoribosylformylglycinamidine cyclo-ligase
MTGQPSSPLASDEAYRQAGVDLKRALAVVDIAKAAAAPTRTAATLGGIGGFSGAFEIPEGYRRPVLLAACDGVGTKLEVAKLAGKHDTIGVDLVAMSVNDILVQAGEPLVFLDYVATDKIEPPILTDILAGVAEGCLQAGCALIGGETAEMPGFYPEGSYDLAGFCVGVAEKQRLLPKHAAMQAGDVLIGLPSTGPHSNGYSLIRKILLQDHAIDLQSRPESLAGQTVAEAILAPTRIYVKPVLALLQQLPEDAVRGMIHVTGGGFYDNIPRILPDSLSAEIDMMAWQPPAIFPYLQALGELSPEAMAHTFNCGIGFILVVASELAEIVLEMLRKTPELATSTRIGHLVGGCGEVHLKW